MYVNREERERERITQAREHMYVSFLDVLLFTDTVDPKQLEPASHDVFSRVCNPHQLWIVRSGAYVCHLRIPRPTTLRILCTRLWHHTHLLQTAGDDPVYAHLGGYCQGHIYPCVLLALLDMVSSARSALDHYLCLLWAKGLRYDIPMGAKESNLVLDIPRPHLVS